MYKKEIEKKFLVNPVLFKKYINDCRIFSIEQSYFKNSPNLRIIRIRREREEIKTAELKYFVTIKTGKGIERYEDNQRVSNESGFGLLYLNTILMGYRIIEKRRFIIKDGWEIDHFLNPELNDLWVAEKELSDIYEKIELPDFVLEEVTDKLEYSNYEIWKRIQ